MFGGFVQDDRRVIIGDSGLGKWDNLFDVWINPYYKNDPGSGAYRPLTSFSFSVDSLVFGKQPWSFRMVNVLLFGSVCVVVYELMKRIFGRDRDAFWVAILYSVLPIHTEAVNNIVGRGEILASGLVVLTLVLAMEKKWELSILMCFLAILAKESAIVWLLPLGIMVWSSKMKNDVKGGLTVSVLIGLAGYFLLRFGVLGSGMFSDNATIVENPLKFIPTTQRVMAGVGLVAFGVSKVIFPFNLSYDYSFEQLKLTSLTGEWLVVGVTIIFISIWLTRRKVAILCWGLSFLWLPLLVTGNILKPIGTIFGERLWFLPSLGVVMIFVWIWGKVTSKKAEWVMWVLVLVFGGRTLSRNFDWLSERKLFINDAVYAKGSVLAQNNAAAMYLLQGKYDEAKIYLERAEAIFPKYPELMYNWGVYFFGKGDRDEAQRRLDSCLKLHKGFRLCSQKVEDLPKWVE